MLSQIVFNETRFPFLLLPHHQHTEELARLLPNRFTISQYLTFFFLITSLVPNCLKLWMSEWNLLSHVQLFVAPWIIQSMEFSLGQNTGVGSLSFLQGIFPTQGSNPGLLHCRHILYQLSHQGSPSNSGELIYSDIDPVRRIIFHNCCFLYFLLCFIGVLFSSLYP